MVAVGRDRLVGLPLRAWGYRPGAIVTEAPLASTASDATWRERLIWGVGVTFAYVVATIVMTWPYAARLGSSTPGGGDPLLQIWIARWVQHALVTNPLRLYDANIFYPYHNTLAYSDSNVPAALLSAPVYLLTGNPILAVNLLVLGTFVLAAGGVYALMVALTGNRAAGFLAGLAYAFLPYRFAHIYHLNQLGHAWTPWVLLALVLLVQRHAKSQRDLGVDDTPRPRDAWRLAVAFGVLFAVQVVTSFYVAFQLVFAVGIALVVAVVAEPATRSWRFLGQLAVAGAVAGAIILPLALPYLRVRDELGLERTVREAERYRAELTSYFKVTGENAFWERLPERGGSEDILFPGGVALVGAALGLLAWRRRPALTTAAVVTGLIALIISLGPTWHPERGGGTPLPYRFLYDHFPFFKAMRVPARFGVLTDFAVVVLAASGFAWVWELLAARLRPQVAQLVGIGATAAVSLLILVELHAAPFPLTAVDRSAEASAPYRWLAEQPDKGAVMEFPVIELGQGERPITLAMYWSTLHWKPLVQGYSGFAPPSLEVIQNTFIGDMKRPNGTVAEAISFVTGDDIGVLQDLGVRYILLHQYSYKREDWPLVLDKLEETGLVERAGEFGEVTIYRLQPRPEGTEIQRANLAIFAPSLVTPGQFWEPTVVARNATKGLSLLSLKGRLDLTTVWRDESGRVVRRDTLPLNLPNLLPPGDLYCSVRLCPAASGDNAPPPTPGEPTLRLYPDQPGRYTVEFVLAGDTTFTQTLAVEVAANAPAPEADGPPLAFGSATADADTYAPGATVGLAMEWTVRRQPTEEYTMFTQLIGPDGKVWGQYDAPAGWTSHYTSAWLPGEKITLPWFIPLQADAPPGQYKLLVGMYRHTPTGVERIPLRYPDGDKPEYVVGELTVR